MIPRVQWEVYLGEEADGQAVAVATSFEAARRLADEGVKATARTHAVVRTMREVVGVVRMPESGDA